ncbi:MAG TPA: PhnD/SsuA/transferrin family substrate-binding protein [Gemmataceae bacterium]|nr:PhnD/SsuA/transferrin family substrate-binding protein [Gemmataceae bacterium]
MSRFLLPALVLALVGADARAGDKPKLRVGIPRSIFRDIPPALLTFANQPFKDIIRTQTGFEGDVVNDAEALNIARDLDAGKVQLAVFLGHEFAWAQQKYPDLEPLLCSVPRPKEIQAFILVRHDCKAVHLGEMKGQRLVLATGTRDHARLFLEKRQVDEMGTMTGFCSLSKTGTVHDALHKLIDNEADVTVADQAAWRYFQKLYPGAAQNLKVLAESSVFPATVIAYKKGALTDDQLGKVRDGLMTAHQSKQGGRLMGMIKVDKFDRLPDGYGDAVKACLKSYPVPPTDWAADK